MTHDSCHAFVCMRVGSLSYRSVPYRVGVVCPVVAKPETYLLTYNKAQEPSERVNVNVSGKPCCLYHMIVQGFVAKVTKVHSVAMHSFLVAP